MFGVLLELLGDPHWLLLLVSGGWVWYWGGVLIGEWSVGVVLGRGTVGGWRVGVVLGRGTDWWVEGGCGIGGGVLMVGGCGVGGGA